MSERSLDELGPIDYVIVEFPPGEQHFSGEGADELLKLHDAGVIRLMDLVIMVKAEDGSVDALELSDVPELGAFGRIEADLAETLAAADVAELATVMAPGTVAAAIVYENLWAAPFASALRHAGAQLVSAGRIPTQALMAAIEADAALEAEEA